MFKHWIHTWRWLLIGCIWFLVHSPVWAGDPFTKPEFIIPQIGVDLSARRLDSEIVGWDKSYQHLAAIGVETLREQDGRHRGEVFLWIFPILEMLPETNVRLHHISHAPHPHDPIPIEDARDLTWTIETPLLWRWPKRPIRKQPKHGMHISPTWYFHRNKNNLCTIYAGASLQWKAEKKALFPRQLDLSVQCSLLRHTDHRIYWGKEDTAGMMIRFDFPKQPSNERSARFIVPINWKQGKSLHCIVESRQQLFPALTAFFEPFSKRIQTKVRASFPKDEPSFIEATEENKGFAEHLATLLGEIPIHWISSPQEKKADIVLVWGKDQAPAPDFTPKSP